MKLIFSVAMIGSLSVASVSAQQHQPAAVLQDAIDATPDNGRLVISGHFDGCVTVNRPIRLSPPRGESIALYHAPFQDQQACWPLLHVNASASGSDIRGIHFARVSEQALVVRGSNSKFRDLVVGRCSSIGVIVNGDHHELKNITLLGCNPNDMYIFGNFNKLVGRNVIGHQGTSTGDGITLRGYGNLISGTLFAGNGLTAIDIQTPETVVDLPGNTVTGNLFVDNGGHAAVRVQSDRNRIVRNRFGDPDLGQNSPALVVTGQSNLIHANYLEGNDSFSPGKGALHVGGNSNTVTSNTVIASTGVGLSVAGTGNQLGRNRSGGARAGETNMGCEFVIGPGNTDLRRNTANGASYSFGPDGDPCGGSPRP